MAKAAAAGYVYSLDAPRNDAQMNPPSRKIKFGLAIVLGIVAMIVLVITAQQLFGHLKNTSASSARKMGGGIPVRISAVEQGVIEEVLGAEGIVKESRSLSIQSEISGLIRTMRVQPGDVVKKGDALAELDDTVPASSVRSASGQIASAQTKLRLSQAKLNRLQGLLQQGLITIDEREKAELEKVEAETILATVKAKLVQAQHDLAASRITAPATGIITAVELVGGVVTKPYINLLTLGVIDPVHFELGLNEDKIRSVQVGQRVGLTFNAYPGRKFQGSVALIKPVIDEKTRLMTIVVRLDNPDLALKPGMRGLAIVTNKTSGLKVPTVSIMSQREDTAEVFTVDANGVTHLRLIKTGLQGNGYVEAREGLTEGEQVVIVGQAGLKDNDKVRVGDEYAPK